MRAALYARVSSEEQVEGYSIDAQRRAFETLCQGRGWIPYHEYIEEGKSAHTEDLEFLLIVEAPPSEYPRRFFYDIDNDKYDSLYLETKSIIFYKLTRGVEGERCKNTTLEPRRKKSNIL